MKDATFLRRYQLNATSTEPGLPNGPIARYLAGMVKYEDAAFLVMGWGAQADRTFQDVWRLTRVVYYT
jgi:hypothetical protein